MSAEIESLAVELYRIVHAPDLLAPDAKIEFARLPASDWRGWTRLARTVSEFTGVSSLQYAARRYTPTPEEEERMRQ